MQQCFGGGFAGSINSALSANKLFNYSFLAASNWNEYSWTESTTDKSNTLQLKYNFTNSYSQSIGLGLNMLQDYTNALTGNGAVTRDPFVPGGSLAIATTYEDPVYASPDALANGMAAPNGPNNSRKFTAANQFAIIVVWSNSEPRFDADVDQITEALENKVGVPASNIVILDSNMAANSQTQAFPKLGLSSHVIDGPTTQANWLKALSGGYFNGPIGNGAKLLIYNTGHGSLWNANAGKAFEAINRGKGANFADVQLTGSFDTADLPEDDDGTDATTDANGQTMLQVSTTTPLPAGVTVTVDGVAAGTLAPADPLSVVDLSPFIGSSYTYDLYFDQTDLASTPTGAPMNFDFIGVTDASQILAIALDGGDQTFAGGVSVVPEPGDPGLAGGLACAFAIRRARRRWNCGAVTA